MSITELHPNVRTIRPDDPNANLFDLVRFFGRGMWIDGNNYIRNDGEHVGKTVRRLLPEATTQPIIVPRMVILHTNAGVNSSPSLYNYLARPDVTGECHLQIRSDGTLEQYMPFNRRADCNYSANRFYKDGKYYGALALETQDNGVGTDRRRPIVPWSLPQLDTIISASFLFCLTYGVACTQPATWDASGIGHHSLFPYTHDITPSWTNVTGKTCPTASRIAQCDYVRAEVAKRLAEFMNLTDWLCRGA